MKWGEQLRKATDGARSIEQRIDALQKKAEANARTGLTSATGTFDGDELKDVSEYFAELGVKVSSSVDPYNNRKHVVRISWDD